MAAKRLAKPIRAAIKSLSNTSVKDIIFLGDALKLAKALPDSSVDLIFSSPPYCMGKEYEKSNSVDDFVTSHRLLVPELIRALKPGGSICWQIGYHVKNGIVTPLDFHAHQVFSSNPELVLRNRVVWSFDHGQHATNRFSGRHETILWYTKGISQFDLDAVRIPQKYPGKKSYKGPNKGKLSGNPLGKNPGDVWRIPNVKGNHVEKTDHPCQFPVALPLTFIKAVCPQGGLVFDPFMGSGSTGVAAAIGGQRFLGCELLGKYTRIARGRIQEARKGGAAFRPFEQPIHEPRPGDSVAKRPAHFKG